MKKCITKLILLVSSLILLSSQADAACRDCSLFYDVDDPDTYQCTKYVCEKRIDHHLGCVAWSGNAGEWLTNAEAEGYKTGGSPIPGAILVTNEGSVGHVAFVESVDAESNQFHVSERNIDLNGGYNERNISFTSSIISGFIYAPCAAMPENQSLIRKEGDSSVYWLQNNKRYHVISVDILADMIGLLGWQQICDYPTSYIDSYAEGPNFIDVNSENLLIKLIDDTKVYRIENGERRWITSEAVFNDLGLEWGDIITVSQKIIDMFPEGDPIYINEGQDINPPVLHDLSFTPSAIDVRGGSQTVTVTLEITDDLSGLDRGRIYLRGPQYGHTVYGYIYSYSQTCPVDNPECGIYQVDLTFGEKVESGIWTINNLYLRDNVTNTKYYYTADLESMGFPTELVVTSNPDITGPTLNSFGVDSTTKTVDVSSTSGEVKFNLAVSDDNSGVNYGRIYCNSPYFSYGGYDYRSHYANGYFNSNQLNENGEVNGVTVFIPQYAKSGTWTCYTYLYDQAQNYTYYSHDTLESPDPDGFGIGCASFEVTAETSDLTPPTLSDFQVEPEVINTINSPDSTIFSVDITDDISGFGYCSIGTRSPSGGQNQYSSISTYYSVPDTTNQFYSEKQYPRYSEFGEWDITLTCRDKLNNYVSYSNEDLEAVGWPSVVKIEGIDNSSVGSGIIGLEGGTIESGDPDGNPDGIVTLEVPYGALSSNTGISITRIGRFDDVDLRIGTATGRGHVLAEYDFQPDGLQFNSAVTITINVDVTDFSQSQRDRIGAFINTDTDGDGIDDTFVDIAATKIFTNNLDGTVTLTMTMEVYHFTSYAVILPNIEEDLTPPIVEVIVPSENSQVQDQIILQAHAVDESAVDSANFTILLNDGEGGQSIGFDEIPATYNNSTGFWELEFDTVGLNDGYYLAKASATDTYGNEGEGESVAFVIRNWSLTELLPASSVFRAGRTVPIKFSINTEPGSVQNTGFIYNEALLIEIYDGEKNILQTSIFGTRSTDYRIDTEAEHYITNFKTSKKPDAYSVEIYRIGLDPPFLIGSFNFITSRK